MDSFGNYTANVNSVSGNTAVSGGGAAFHGNGAPDASLGTSGSIYVDDLTGALYWKSSSGWLPQ